MALTDEYEPQKEPGEGFRTKYEPTKRDRRMVGRMCAMGMNQGDMAALIGVHPETLRLHFRVELDTYAVAANEKVMQTLFKMATSGKDVAATIFWCKARIGLRDRPADGAGTGKDAGSNAGGPPVTITGGLPPVPDPPAVTEAAPDA